MITVHVLVAVLLTTHLPNVIALKAELRVYHGVDDVTSKYPYVVSIQPLRMCTGSLITANWVLTAAHCCVKGAKLIQYGNMSIPLSVTDSRRNVLKMIQHPRYRKNIFAPNDIGFILVSPVAMNKYASVSTVDYSTLKGASAEYAGFGLTFLPKKKIGYKTIILHLSLYKPLQIGEAIIRPCPYRWKGFICISPKCSITQLTAPGDSGGPLIIDHKIVGLVSGALDDDFKDTDRFFTPISPHISWINSVVASERDIKTFL